MYVIQVNDLFKSRERLNRFGDFYSALQYFRSLSKQDKNFAKFYNDDCCDYCSELGWWSGLTEEEEEEYCSSF